MEKSIQKKKLSRAGDSKAKEVKKKKKKPAIILTINYVSTCALNTGGQIYNVCKKKKISTDITVALFTMNIYIPAFNSHTS